MLKNKLMMKKRKAFLNGRSIGSNRGFTLLEALLGFLVLSVGMMGIASLQALSLKASQTSVYRSVAVMKVDELLESMRANATALDSYEGAGADSGCSANACDAVALAAEDVFWWKKNLKAGLPDAATSAVVIDAAAVLPSKMATVTVSVSWSERNSNASGDGTDNDVDITYSTTANICTGYPC